MDGAKDKSTPGRFGEVRSRVPVSQGGHSGLKDRDRCRRNRYANMIRSTVAATGESYLY